jgi:SAM-dependent methyltransferase
MIRKLVAALALIIAIPYVLNQVRRPTRWVGRLFLWGMNRSHSALTDWGLAQLRIEPAFTILDVGCGGGRTVRKLAALAPQGKVFGIDYALGSVAASRAENAEQIAAGRVEILQAPVSHLPFPEATFDLVTAVETHYYWPNLADDVREVCRVMKPGGQMIVIAEAYRSPRHALEGVVLAPLRVRLLTPDQHRELLASAGLSNVRVVTEHGWICAIGQR